MFHNYWRNLEDRLLIAQGTLSDKETRDKLHFLVLIYEIKMVLFKLF